MTLCDILWSLGSAIYNAGCALIRYCYLKNSLRVELQVLIQGVPYYWTRFVFFLSFLGFWSTYRGTFYHFSTALEICYIIATRILKIDLEIAEIIEVKVGTCNTEIIFWMLCNSKMSISKLTGANFDLNYLSYF